MATPGSLERFIFAAAGFCGCAWLVSAGVSAQEADLSFPPRIDGTPLEARFEPAAADQPSDQPMEEIIVTHRREWRLPDLGSAWRIRQQEEAEPARIEASFLPLYDPDNPMFPASDPWVMHREMRRVGFIELFRIRFGNRDR